MRHFDQMDMPSLHTRSSGFTLIELSIVLVIIGLIVGGVLVGQDLIKAAEVRAQISQFEKYTAAANTFRAKYNFLPGDIPDPQASSFGFKTRGNSGIYYAGMGDGNGVIQGTTNGSTAQAGFAVTTGEAALFWADLSSANLIDGTFTSVIGGNYSVVTTGSAIGAYLPAAKMGRSAYMYIFNGRNAGAYLSPGDGSDFFSFSTFVSTGSNLGWDVTTTPSLTAIEAYNIDIKLDDGAPQSGKVLAKYYNYSLINYGPSWAAGGGVLGAGININSGGSPTTSATPASTSTCYDNGNATGAAQAYTTTNATQLNCAVAFKFN